MVSLWGVRLGRRGRGGGSCQDGRDGVSPLTLPGFGVCSGNPLVLRPLSPPSRVPTGVQPVSFCFSLPPYPLWVGPTVVSPARSVVRPPGGDGGGVVFDLLRRLSFSVRGVRGVVVRTRVSSVRREEGAVRGDGPSRSLRCSSGTGHCRVPFLVDSPSEWGK